MTNIRPKQFIETVLIKEIGELTNTNPYLSFVLIGIGIEFLGKCLDSNEND